MLEILINKAPVSLCVFANSVFHNFPVRVPDPSLLQVFISSRSTF